MTNEMSVASKLINIGMKIDKNSVRILTMVELS
jgi:hypothetical protein